jgi:phytanoyl-CoA hydroxylase
VSSATYRHPRPLSETQLKQFARDGFLVMRGLADTRQLERITSVSRAALAPPLAPLEYEADVNYPGAPASRDEAGGDTPRRLLHAYSRDPAFREWATAPVITATVCELLGSQRIALSQNHHNCLMTKHPGYSSATHRHQDIRYGSFDRPDLVSVWLALGAETPANGCLRVIAGSHRLEIDRGRLDAELFLRTDLADNQALIETARNIELVAGDTLFFHSRVFHYAGQNLSEQTKLSLVFTYHAIDNQPIPGTRSARFADIVLNPGGVV